MIMSPEKIKFEDRNDIIDYVSKGLPPTKGNYEKIIAVIKNPSTDESSQKAGSDVIISKNLLDNSLGKPLDPEAFTEVLDEVYKNRVKERNILIGITAVTVISVIVGSIISSKKKKEDESDSAEIFIPR